MNEILKIYQQRLNEIAKVFINLLNNIEKSKLFVQASTSQYRLQFLGHMIKSTLESHQQKTIKKLSQKIGELIYQSDRSTHGQFQSINIEIPHNFHQQIQTISQKVLRCRTPTSLSGHKNQKLVSQTKVNSFEQDESESEQYSNKPISQKQQSILSYKFKYLKLKL